MKGFLAAMMLLYGGLLMMVAGAIWGWSTGGQYGHDLPPGGPTLLVDAGLTVLALGLLAGVAVLFWEARRQRRMRRNG